MACLQVVAQSRAGWILEWSKGIHYNASQATGEVDPWLRYIEQSDWPLFEVDSTGHLAITDRPGLGVNMNWKEIQKASKVEVVWRDENMSLPDGTRANW
jgi:L-alanine-DL-glutamate epimerase-like enolase superfamily enzyme